MVCFCWGGEGGFAGCCVMLCWGAVGSIVCATVVFAFLYSCVFVLYDVIVVVFIGGQLAPPMCLLQVVCCVLYLGGCLVAHRAWVRGGLVSGDSAPGRCASGAFLSTECSPWSSLLSVTSLPPSEVPM